VDRVRRTALKLAKALDEGKEQGFAAPDILLVELVALFHDMADGEQIRRITFPCAQSIKCARISAKYAETSSLETVLAPFLHSSIAKSLLSENQTSLLLSIIPRISWSTEKKLRAAGQWDGLVAEMQKNGGWSELAVVQDADRLDAIGAFGVSIHVPLPDESTTS
jgi:uncharacterized protein